MSEDSVCLRGQSQAAERRGKRREIRHFRAGDVIEIALFTAVLGHAEVRSATRARSGPEIGDEPLPVRRNGLAAFPGVALIEPGYEQRLAVLQAYRPEILDDSLVQLDGFDEIEVAGAALRPDRFGREVKLIAKCPREGFMGAVTGLQRHGQNIGCAVRKRTRRLRQATPPHIADKRTTGRNAE